MAGRVLDFWFEPVPEARLKLFQRGFVLTFVIYIAAWAEFPYEWLTTYGYHLTAATTSRAYPVPLTPLPPWLLVPFLVGLFATSVAGVLAIGGRVTMILLVGFAYYVQMVDQPSSFTLNKLFVVYFTLLAVQPSAKVFRDPSGAKRRYISAWPLRTIQAGLVLQYFTAGICKMAHGDWLKEADILLGHSVGLYRTEVAALVVEHLPHFAWIALSVGALAFEVGSPLLFLVKRIRPFGLVFGVVMHLSIAVLMVDLIYFSLQMIWFYVLFVDEAVVLRTEARICSMMDSAWARIRRLPTGIFGRLRRRGAAMRASESSGSHPR